MGAQLAALTDLNPLSAISSTIKAVAHDCSMYVCNAAQIDSNCCQCWRFKVQTFETGEPEKVEHSMGVVWH